MQAIMEPIFEIPYLIGVVLLGILTIRRAKGRRQFILFGAMAIVLGGGDAFHLIPRMWALLTTGVTNLPAQAAAQLRYQAPRKALLTGGIYLLAAARIVLCLLPQNRWLSADAPLSWGIYRNLPFVAMGLVIIILYYREAKKQKDAAFRFMWLAITLSFMFYIPVVLFADAIPLMGMLMIPKTCAYVWIVLMGFWDAKRTQPHT